MKKTCRVGLLSIIWVAAVSAITVVAECPGEKAHIGMCPAGQLLVCTGKNEGFCHEFFAVPDTLQNGPFSCEDADGLQQTECVTMTAVEAGAAPGQGRCYLRTFNCEVEGNVCEANSPHVWVTYSPLFKTDGCRDPEDGGGGEG